jgi:hypothetical protein
MSKPILARVIALGVAPSELSAAIRALSAAGEWAALRDLCKTHNVKFACALCGDLRVPASRRTFLNILSHNTELFTVLICIQCGVGYRRQLR